MEEDRRCDWFKISHKGYRNFTKMSAKSLNARIQAAFSSKNLTQDVYNNSRFSNVNNEFNVTNA